MLYSQARVVINNNGYIVIDNAAFLVLDNANSNALTTTGSGGNIVSEDENDVIQWEIGATTGTYVVPWTTTPVVQGGNGTKIPLTFSKTTSGNGATAEFILSTYETTTDMNAPYPSVVSNMNYSGIDKSLFVIDRFWHIDALSYTTKPDMALTIAYDPTANEMLGTNTITEANLQAQRFNTSLGHWEAYKLFGSANTVSNLVSGITVPSADFFEDWILVDNTNPLPVELVSFVATCESNVVNINWSTQTEINNDYFVVEKSYDEVNFFELTTLQGAGNSSVTNYYNAIDNEPASGVSYYRLKQVDFNGDVEFHQLVSTSCDSEGFVVNQLTLKNNALDFNISSVLDEDLTIYFYDYRGRIIANKVEQIQSGNNFISLTNLELSTGIYMLSIFGKQHSYARKLMNRKSN
jgi:hypothetical protein